MIDGLHAVPATSLTTTRLTLRHWRREDLAPFAAMNANPRGMEHFPGTLDQAASDALGRAVGDELARHGFGLWAVEVPGIAPFIGFVGLREPASEAARAVVAYAFGRSPWRNLSPSPSARPRAVRQRGSGGAAADPVAHQPARAAAGAAIIIRTTACPSLAIQPADLIDLATALLTAAGIEPGRARLIGELLVEADLMGHTTHGLALLPGYLDGLAAGTMTKVGEPLVIRDTGPCVTWDGQRLPGVWLTARAIDIAIPRARQYGTATVVIRRSHHIACLGTFLTRATDQGLMILLASSDPADASVAPFGGTTGVFTPDPIAVGIPTEGDPILIDTSASITTNGMSARLRAEGRRFAHSWLLDAAGNPTDDPQVLVADPPGTIQPAGGLDHGHKGYGLALMVEALTMGLGGFGRRGGQRRLGRLRVRPGSRPRRLCGCCRAFAARPTWIADACHASAPRPGVERVRLPGEAALARRAQAMAEGVELYPGIMDRLSQQARRLGLEK